MIDTNLAGEAQGVYTARYPVGVGAATLPTDPASGNGAT
jgi:hypothetical protein